ncbi:MAG: hypothetical protein WDZ63_11490 [Burkholderiales bacterium]
MKENSLKALLVVLVSAASLGTGCASESRKESTAPAQVAAAQADATASNAVTQNTTYYFAAYPESGRIYAMSDVKNWLLFSDHGEVPYTRTRIGAGPQGQTVVFGITSGDVKANAPSVGERIYDGQMQVEGAFYAEVMKNGRYHVFGLWQDFQDFLAHGEITYTFTQIGAGPKGETVIYALNKESSKQGAPVALIEKFKQLRSM